MHLSIFLGSAVGQIALFLIAAPTALRTAINYPDGEFAIWKVGGMLGVFLSATASALAVIFLAVSIIDPSAGLPNFNHEIPHWKYAATGLLVLNVLSLSYELGRNPSEAAKPEAKKTDPDEIPADGVSDFMTMLDSICGFETISPTQASELYRRIIDLLGEKKVTPNEAKRLHDHVQNGVKNSLA